MNNYKDLRVWQESVELAVLLIEAGRRFPRDLRFELGSQVIRAALSVPSNIAEGHGRFTMRDRRRFPGVARGSLNELETQLEVVGRLDLIPRNSVQPLLKRLSDVRRGLEGLIRYAESQIENTRR